MTNEVASFSQHEPRVVISILNLARSEPVDPDCSISHTVSQSCCSAM